MSHQEGEGQPPEPRAQPKGQEADEHRYDLVQAFDQQFEFESFEAVGNGPEELHQVVAQEGDHAEEQKQHHVPGIAHQGQEDERQEQHCTGKEQPQREHVSGVGREPVVVPGDLPDQQGIQAQVRQDGNKTAQVDHEGVFPVILVPQRPGYDHYKEEGQQPDNGFGGEFEADIFSGAPEQTHGAPPLTTAGGSVRCRANYQGLAGDYPS